jgi:(R,R)-butanediol dehydrogenase/meso-butanediol dehydrogenase/diacetyl reductase
MTESMMAVRFHGPKNMSHEEVDRPALTGADQVKIKIEAAGICGSDLHVYETGAYVTQIPVVMGHEFAGIVLEVGQEVHLLSPGDHVVGDSRKTCGVCENCTRGEGNLCGDIGFLGEVRDGAFAEEMVIEESSLVKIDPKVPSHIASLAEPLAVALHAISKTNIDQHTNALVIGAGPMGALIHSMLKIKGLHEAYIADISQYRREVIRKSFPESVVEPQGEYDLVFETTGAATAVKEILPQVLALKGTLIMVGLFKDAVPFGFTQLVEKEWTFRGCAAFASELTDAARILEDHWPQFDSIVSHRLPLSDCQKAFDLLLDPRKEAMKIVFSPQLRV